MLQQIMLPGARNMVKKMQQIYYKNADTIYYTSSLF